MAAERVSLRHVATMLGVSTMTVSRALRGRPGVSETLRAYIRQKADALGYTPDPTIHRLTLHLSSLRQRGVRAVICALTDIPAPLEPVYCTRLRHHAEARARELGFAFGTLRIRRGSDDWKSLPRVLSARGVEGVLLLPMISPLSLDALCWDTFSVVAATAGVSAPTFHRVAVNYAMNARLLVGHLAALGHRRIGFVSTLSHTLRSHEAFPSALAWHHTRLGVRCRPLLHPRETRPDLVGWARAERPEIVVVARETDLAPHREVLRAAGLTPAWALSAIETLPATVPGIDERQEYVGVTAIDVLAGMIARGERGVPSLATMTLIPGIWRDAATVPSPTGTL